MRLLTRLFLAGLVAVVPVVVTVAFLIWLGGVTEHLLGSWIKLAIPNHYYRPGMGIAAGVVVVLAVGALTHTWLFRRLLDIGDTLLDRIPLVKTLHGALRDLMGFFVVRDQKRFSRVVLVSVANPPLKLIGFVPRDDCTALPESMGGEDTIAVYLPMSYQIGGYTALLPRSSVTPLEMSLEEAMRFTVTAGMSAPSASTDVKPMDGHGPLQSTTIILPESASREERKS